MKTNSRFLLAAALMLALTFTFSCSSDDKDGGGNPGGSTQTNVVYGEPVPYKDEIYKTVIIGTQTWFQRNLNYAVEGSKCVDGKNLSDANTATCDTYGRLYDWATAMNLLANCNYTNCASQVSTRHQGICPSGWHIPSKADWNVLMTAVGGEATAGKKLKARSGWDDHPNGSSGNGTDDYGFSALPGGLGFGGGGGPVDFDDVGYWWSSSESSTTSIYGYYYAYTFELNYDGDSAEIDYDSRHKGDLYSVRCVKN